MDPRKELSLINKHIRQHHRDSMGEYLLWFEFMPLATAASAGSLYDDVYDEGAPGTGGRSYAGGLSIPTIYVEEFEDRFTAQEEGRQPTQNISATILFVDMERAGISNVSEYNTHLNDIIFYDNRYYKINEYRVRGRLPGDVLIAVQGYEVFLDQEFVFDPGPGVPVAQDLPWPSTFPAVGV